MNRNPWPYSSTMPVYTRSDPRLTNPRIMAPIKAKSLPKPTEIAQGRGKKWYYFQWLVAKVVWQWTSQDEAYVVSQI